MAGISSIGWCHPHAVRHMKLRSTAITCLTLVAMVPGWAIAQASRVTLVATDGSGTLPSCDLHWKLDNGSEKKLSLMLELTATSASKGSALSMTLSTIPVSAPAGGSKEIDYGNVNGARCKDVKLQVTGETCVPRKACQLAFETKGLAGFERAPR